MKSDPENLVQMVSKVIEWLVKQRWKKIAWASVSCLKFQSKIRARAGSAIVMQKIIRMHMARSVHRARYLGIKNIRQLGTQLAMMNEIVEKLPKNKEKMAAVCVILFFSDVVEQRGAPQGDRVCCAEHQGDGHHHSRECQEDVGRHPGQDGQAAGCPQEGAGEAEACRGGNHLFVEHC